MLKDDSRNQVKYLFKYQNKRNVDLKGRINPKKGYHWGIKKTLQYPKVVFKNMSGTKGKRRSTYHLFCQFAKTWLMINSSFLAAIPYFILQFYICVQCALTTLTAQCFHAFLLQFLWKLFFLTKVLTWDAVMLSLISALNMAILLCAHDYNSHVPGI